MRISRTDEYGVVEYPLWFKILIAFSVLYLYISLMAFPLLSLEQSVGNIKEYSDAFWVLQMSASTIGFGDFYPVTTEGRWIVALSFYVGVGLAGYIGSAIASAFTNLTDNSIQNRELRQQNAEILEQLKKIKEK